MVMVDKGILLYIMQPSEWQFSITKYGVTYSIWAKCLGGEMCTVPKIIKFPWRKDRHAGLKEKRDGGTVHKV